MADGSQRSIELDHLGLFIFFPTNPHSKQISSPSRGRNPFGSIPDARHSKEMSLLTERIDDRPWRRLFEEHTELLSLFEKFQSLKTRDEQASSLELAEHAASVMSSLDESIRCLDNMDDFQLYLTQVGQSHCKIEGFQKEYFWVSYLFPCLER